MVGRRRITVNRTEFAVPIAPRNAPATIPTEASFAARLACLSAVACLSLAVRSLVIVPPLALGVRHRLSFDRFASHLTVYTTLYR